MGGSATRAGQTDCLPWFRRLSVSGDVPFVVVVNRFSVGFLPGAHIRDSGGKYNGAAGSRGRTVPRGRAPLSRRPSFEVAAAGSRPRAGGATREGRGAGVETE